MLAFEGGRETQTVSLILILPSLGLGIGNQIATNPFILTQWAVNVEIATVQALLGLLNREACVSEARALLRLTHSASKLAFCLNSRGSHASFARTLSRTKLSMLA
jgi:hypothetical protein